MNLGSLLARINDTKTGTRWLRIQPGSSRAQVGPKLGLSAEKQALLARMTDEHDAATLIQWVGQ